MNDTWTEATAAKVERIKKAIIYYETMIEKAREKLKAAEELLALRREKYKR